MRDWLLSGSDWTLSTTISTICIAAPDHRVSLLQFSRATGGAPGAPVAIACTTRERACSAPQGNPVRDRFLYRVYIMWYGLDSVYRDLTLVPEG